MQRYVIYKRVSTKEQGRSGLGLDAQDRDIGIFLEAFSDEPFEVIGAFTDVQTGSTSDRPQLREALAIVRKERAILLVAKLDRLSRKVAFIATLMDDKAVQLRVATMPSADPFQFHIYAALAEQERKFISARTKAALAEARAKGRKLGGLRDATGKRNEAVQREALARAERVSGIVVPLRRQGATLRQIAEALNASGVPTARGGEWQAVQVQRTLTRLGKGAT
jgi:DNA invertase Pin-like site-specific DNA recombinase